jgi:tetratricopeptide (TPR) repeat protein
MADGPSLAPAGDPAGGVVTPERWKRVKEVLDDALAMPAAGRPVFLAKTCAGDAALLREVESLLEEARGEWSFLDLPEGKGASAAFEDFAPRSRVGERIGAYEVLGELGRGGMGMVYLARRADDEFQKKVAIKLVRPGMASEEALRRFRSERQISATLDHPHIARLLDGGRTGDGEPYFVMEFVEGEPLLDYCANRKLATEQRLRLFRDVCAAVQYAHQNLIVHRDIKPSNILVTGEGAVKLLDFGIAKLLNPEGVVATADQTATLARVLTPDYASPEQVRGEAITTASDVYALGVVLYELLTGKRPYRVTSTESAELIRVVCDTDPDRPSTVSKSRELKGDLDAIVLKAMRKEPRSRYGSAEQLSEDIRRHLEGRPVEARRGTFSYRAGKFFRRHRLGLAAAALVLVAVAGGVWATLREARRARVAEARAERRFNDVRKLANSFLFEFHDAIRDLPGATPARELLVRRALEYLDDLARESAGDRALARELAEAYQKVGDVQGNPYGANLGDLKGALESYGKSIALLEPAVAAGGSTVEERSALAAAYLARGGVELASADANVAVASARKGLALREELARSTPADGRRQMELAQAWQWLSFNLAAAGRVEEASRALRRQRAILEERRRTEPGSRPVLRALAQNCYLTGSALRRAGDLDRALAAFAEARALQEALRREDPTSVLYARDLAYTVTETGNTQIDRDDARAGLEAYRAAGAIFQDISTADAKSTDGVLGVAMSHHNAGEALLRLSRRADALLEFRRARSGYESVVAAAPSNMWVFGMLGMLYVALAQAQGGQEPESSCALYKRSVTVFEKIAATGALSEDSRAAFDLARARARACN